MWLCKGSEAKFNIEFCTNANKFIYKNPKQDLTVDFYFFYTLMEETIHINLNENSNYKKRIELINDQYKVMPPGFKKYSEDTIKVYNEAVHEYNSKGYKLSMSKILIS